jgi:hypothetical protein
MEGNTMPRQHSSRAITITCNFTHPSGPTAQGVSKPGSYTYSFPSDAFASQVTEHARRKYAFLNHIPARWLGHITTAACVSGHRSVDSDLGEWFELRH